MLKEKGVELNKGYKQELLSLYSPTILIELSFLKEELENIAQGIIQGIVDYSGFKVRSDGYETLF